MVNIYLTEILGGKYKLWEGGDTVFIHTQTGSGKTTFILETLSQYAMSMNKEVLLIVNRKILKNQIKKELAREHGMREVAEEEVSSIREFGGITVVSYQEIQEELKSKPFPLGTLFANRFRFVVFDEIHYILEDALFNRDIPFLLEAIPKVQNATKIFLSATLEEVLPFLMGILCKELENVWKVAESDGECIYDYAQGVFGFRRLFYYSGKPEFKIGNIHYFREVDSLSQTINKDDTDEKWLIFVNSKNEAKKMQETLTKDFSYLDADVEEDNSVRQQIVNESKFGTKVLITTKVLDNGINLKDKHLKNLVLMTTAKTEFLQMLGRKRYMEGENGVNLYLMERNCQYFSYLINKKIKPAFHYINEVHEDCIFRQERMDEKDFYNFTKKMAIIRDGKITISAAAKEKLCLDFKFYSGMVEKLREDPHAYICEQLSWIGQAESFHEGLYLESEEKEDSRKKILKFLEEIKGQKLDKDGQQDFRKKIAELAQEYGEKLTDRGSRLVGKAKINQFCEEEKIGFRVEAVKNSRFWEVKEVKNEQENICD